MVVKHRLGILRELVEEFVLMLHVVCVPSWKNKSDPLTRVKGTLLGAPEEEEEERVACCMGTSSVRDNMGVDRTLFVARKVDPAVTRNDVWRAVRRCQVSDNRPSAVFTYNGGS